MDYPQATVGDHGKKLFLPEIRNNYLFLMAEL